MDGMAHAATFAHASLSILSSAARSKISPRITTVSIARVAAISSSGFFVSSTRSAATPDLIAPYRPSQPNHAGPAHVAEATVLAPVTQAAGQGRDGADRVHQGVAPS